MSVPATVRCPRRGVTRSSSSIRSIVWTGIRGSRTRGFGAAGRHARSGQSSAGSSRTVTRLLARGSGSCAESLMRSEALHEIEGVEIVEPQVLTPRQSRSIQR